MRGSGLTGYRIGIRRPVQRNAQVARRPVKAFHRCCSVLNDFRRRLLWLDRGRSFRSWLSACRWSRLQREKERSWSLLEKRQVVKRRSLRSPTIQGVTKALVSLYGDR